MELYLQAERKKGKDKLDKPLDEIDYEKNKNEFTFQPNKGKLVKKSRNFSPKVTPHNRERLMEPIGKVRGSQT